MKWVYLIIAIVGEMIATSSLKESAGFTKLLPSIITVIGYGVTFYFLSLALKQIPIGIAYAVWAGVGILLVAIVGYFRFHQKLDGAALIGMSLIVCGVVIMQVFSKTLSS
ncbi:MAG: multidrug efflux SMR transporter [Cyclobacteriaceae bacterium]|nr:multidrug efflux SMR transporter [Cyclobacteriaceae bacterium HetDA_MAG_MS6]